ncbi:MAG: tetraacyldisaccharide 4'-kinase [Proteobacteria bacterium]|nr:tetraacyldisaccharide 4'-kinase [Pseudomonadota bacterium]MBI3499383.1 tetraacyldisaccharide 4'-kinase [Pseudomonadota bacterium]
MRAPEFWATGGWPALALAPLGSLYDLGSRLRRRMTTAWRAPVPLLCVGNLVLGGAGKTPVTLALARSLAKEGAEVVSRGYGGHLAGPVRVDPTLHRARDVGDEPLLLAEAAPTWVAKSKRQGVEAAIAAGAKAVLLDDGLQNPGLVYDLALAVVDGGFGFGNGHVVPAGPLRESIDRGLARAHAVVLIGADRTGVRVRVGGIPVIEADLVPDAAAQRWRGRRVVAFAGIGRPQKFFDTLAELGASLIATHAFADHHAYREDEIMALVENANRTGAVPVTTAKDWVRLPAAARPMIEVVRVDLLWSKPEAMAALINERVRRG